MASGSHGQANATVLRLGTLGIGNGCVDFKAMMPGFAAMAYNNTYCIQAYPRAVYEAALANITAPATGCNDLTDRCRALAAAGDPTGQGTNQTVNEACVAASAECILNIQMAYQRYSDVSVAPPR